MTTTPTVKPAVLINEFPFIDSAGNRLQHIKLLFICGHTDEWYACDLGKGWKPASNAQLMREHLRITCPIGYKTCPRCAQASNAATYDQIMGEFYGDR